MPLNAEGARSRKGEDLLRIMPIKHSGLQGRLQSGQAAFPLFRRKLIKMRIKHLGISGRIHPALSEPRELTQHRDFTSKNRRK